MGAAQPQDNRTEIDGLNIHYVEWTGDGPTLVCLHGLTANCRYFDSLGESLVPEYRVIAYDLRGRGESDKPKSGYNLISHTIDLEAFLNALSLERVVLVGHSLGAAIAGLFTARSPAKVDRLVLIDGGASTAPQERERIYATVQPLVQRLEASYKSLDEYLETVKSVYGLYNWSRWMQTTYSFDVTVHDDGSVTPRLRAEVAVEDLTALVNYDISAALSTIACPALLLWAPEGFSGAPPLLSGEAARAIANAIPDCELVGVNGANHVTILLAQPSPIAEVIREFLKR